MVGGPAAARQSHDRDAGALRGRHVGFPQPRNRVLERLLGVARAETELAHLTRQLHKLDATLSDGDLFSRDPARAAELSKTRAKVVDAIAKAEEEWLAASEALQTA